MRELSFFNFFCYYWLSFHNHECFCIGSSPNFCWLFALVFSLGCVYLCSHLPCTFVGCVPIHDFLFIRSFYLHALLMTLHHRLEQINVLLKFYFFFFFFISLVFLVYLHIYVFFLYVMCFCVFLMCFCISFLICLVYFVCMFVS